jgi:hypothetical protein
MEYGSILKKLAKIIEGGCLRGAVNGRGVEIILFYFSYKPCRTI